MRPIPLRQVTRGLVAMFAVLTCSFPAAGASGGSSTEPTWVPPVTLSPHSVGEASHRCWRLLEVTEDAHSARMSLNVTWFEA